MHLKSTCLIKDKYLKKKKNYSQTGTKKNLILSYLGQVKQSKAIQRKPIILLPPPLISHLKIEAMNKSTTNNISKCSTFFNQTWESYAAIVNCLNSCPATLCNTFVSNNLGQCNF